MFRTLVLASALAVAASSAASAQTADWSKKTQLTFSAPVQIPGKTLDAGTYTFRVMDLPADRQVLQILDKDEANLIATVMAVSRSRQAPFDKNDKDKNVVMFAERTAGTPVAVQIWYYPGNPIGNEFVYPRAQALEIAKSTHKAVLSREDDSTNPESIKSSKVTRIDENGQPVKSDDEDKDSDKKK